ncbi:MAG: IPT/TIG domain-containing protein [Bacteroidota bacterium]
MQKLRQFRLLPLVIIAIMISIGVGCNKDENNVVPTPQITSVTPNLALVGESLTVTIAGAGFTSETQVSFGVGVIVSQVTFNDATSLSVDIEVAETATAGSRDVVITNPDGTAGNTVTGESMFEITEELGIISVTPGSGLVGESVTVNLAGSGFDSGTTVSFGSDVTVANVTYVSSSSLDVDIDVAATATPGTCDVIVTNTDGQTATGTALFEITADLDADGFIYYCDNEAGTITKMRISDESIIETWTPTVGDVASLQGIEFYGSDLWLSSGGTSDEIYQLNPADWSMSTSFIATPEQTGTVREVAFDADGNMWVANNDAYETNKSKIYKIDKTDGSKVDSVSGPVDGNDIRGIVFVGEVLYANDKQEDKVYSYDFTSKTWTEEFVIPVPASVTADRIFPTGMTWDGTNFWMTNSSYEHDYLLKISPTGELLHSIYIDNTKLTGIAFTH